MKPLNSTILPFSMVRELVVKEKGCISIPWMVQFSEWNSLTCYVKSPKLVLLLTRHKATKTSTVKLFIPQILSLFQHWQAAPSNSLCAFCLPLPYEQATTNPCQRCPTAEKMCLHDIFSFKLFNVTNNYYMRWKFLMTESTPVWSLNWCMDIMTW